MIKQNQQDQDNMEIETQQTHNKQIQTEVLQSLTPLSSTSNDQFNMIIMKQFKQMEGTPQQKLKKLMNRLNKFFLRDSKASINVKDGYFCQKRQPFYYENKNIKHQVHILNNQIILFGIDFIKHREINKMYKPQRVETIDMSHLKLIFNDFQSAMEALRKNQREQVQENGVKLQINKLDPPKGWMEMKPYYISTYERRLLARFATSQQRDITQTGRLSSNIPLYAKKVYQLKQKQSQDIEENCRLRDQKLRQRKFEKLQRKSVKCNQSERNGGQRSNKYQKSHTGRSQISDYRIGKGGHGPLNQLGQQKNQRQRQRSRQKDFDDDKKSVASGQSSLSSLAGQMQNNMNMGDNQDSKSVDSDLSFILHRDQQAFQDMAIRLGLITMNQAKNKQQQNSNKSFSFNGNMEQGINILNNQSNNSSFSSQQGQNYRLTQNMPDKQNKQFSFSKKNQKFNYNEYIQRNEKEQQRRRKQQRQMVIIISDSEDQGLNNCREENNKISLNLNNQENDDNSSIQQ